MHTKKVIKIVAVVAALAAGIFGICMSTLHFRTTDYIGCDHE